MRTKEEITVSLNVIRAVVDADVIDCDINAVENKLLRLTQLMGLSAETMASAKKILGIKELHVLDSMEEGKTPTEINKRLNASCYEENAILQYSDRLNSAIVHNCDALRSIISLRKEEMKAGIGGT